MFLAEMMDAVEIRPMRADIGRFLGLVIENRHVDVAIGKEHCAIRAAPQLLEAERRFVEIGNLRRLFGSQCDVFDACHELLPSRLVVISPRRHGGHEEENGLHAKDTKDGSESPPDPSGTL